MLNTTLNIVISLLVGAFTWSFLEYVIHRWLGHSKKPRTEFGTEHRAHHRAGDYFTPTTRKVMVAVPLILLLGSLVTLAAWLLTDVATGVTLGAAYTVGFAAFYTTYELAHRRIHTHPPIGPYTRLIRKHHLHHHFRSARVNHGVTSPLWDMVFGTYVKPDLIRVPERKIMVWLTDPETGAVKDRYQADYAILRQSRKKKAAA